MTDTSERTEPNAETVSNTNSVSTAAPVSNAAAAPNDADAASSGSAKGEAQASSASGEQAHDTEEGGAEDDGEAGEATSAGDVAAAGAEGAASGTAKRKRRRRRKRKDGTSAGTEGAPTEGGEGARPEARKKESHAPFAHLFGAGQSAKRHAFSPGEVVAGRVTQVEHGVIVVDLFGKATAIVDEYEPREVPVLPDPPEAPAEEPAADAEPAAATSETATLVGGLDAPVVGASAEPQPDVAPEAAPEAALESSASATVTDVLAPEVEANAHAEAGAEADDSDDEGDDAEDAAALPPREKPEAPKLGQVFKGRVGAVSESGHVALVNRIIDVSAARSFVDARRAEHKRVEGVVYGFNRGGFDVLVEGLRAFCPASAMALGEIPDPLEYVGKKLEFLLPASKASGKDIIVSRRSILERLQRRQAKEFLRTLAPGQRFKGRVTAVRDFGVFVDIGGVEGLVHQSELSHAFGVKPSSVAQPGDELEVKVLKVGGEGRNAKEGGRRDRVMRVSLSVKALLPDPWEQSADKLTEGNVIKGKVVRTTDFGAFIELSESIEGLLHITELGRDLKHASQAIREGEEIYVAIERVDRRAHRVSLSRLSPAEVQAFEAGTLTRDDEAVRSLRQGQNVKLKVERIEPRCVFARVEGTVGKRGRAFIPSSETGTDRGTDLRKRFPLGSELEAKIIGIDRDGSLKCSVKAMQVDEERQAVKNYRREAAKQGFGTFGDLLRAKLGDSPTK